ncbi:MAG: hypothetical protein GF411_02245 [Candidatus Lokiarchaeota archaeon]|nr:hypothetical protein [Candidatus Lokiarchaeota archaeon]
MSTLPECSPLCKKFKCEKQPRALKIRRKSGQKIIWCTWVDDECDGPFCKFGACAIRKMTMDGYCKRVTKKKEPDDLDYIDDDFPSDEAIPKKYAKKIKTKGK